MVKFFFLKVNEQSVTARKVIKTFSAVMENPNRLNDTGSASGLYALAASRNAVKVAGLAPSSSIVEDKGNKAIILTGENAPIISAIKIVGIFALPKNLFTTESLRYFLSRKEIIIPIINQGKTT